MSFLSGHEIVLYEDGFHRVSRVERRLYYAYRSPAVFESREEMEGQMAAMDDALRHIQRSRSVLVVDLREARGRNDMEFEAHFPPLRQRFLGGWKKVALIVGSAVGKMQVGRHMREDGFTHAEVFTSEEEAEIFARANLGPISLG